MRKRYCVIGAAALLGVAVAVPTIAHSDVTSQTIKSVVTPSKLSASKKTPTPASIRVDTDSNWDSFAAPSNPHPATINADIDFDKGMIFNTKPVKPCALSKLANTTTAQATAACGPSKVGSGSATLQGVLPGVLHGTVTAFNGTPSGGAPTIYLHTRVDQPALTTVLVGTLIKSPAGAPYGMRLHVPIPATQIGGGKEVITHFDTTVNKKFTIKKKGKSVKSGYVTAICPKSKKLSTQGTFQFAEGPLFTTPTVTKVATTTQPCKPIPAKK
jgi:hypothetical protein